MVARLGLPISLGHVQPEAKGDFIADVLSGMA
jgi:hypothetical protein